MPTPLSDRDESPASDDSSAKRGDSGASRGDSGASRGDSRAKRGDTGASRGRAGVRDWVAPLRRRRGDLLVGASIVGAVIATIAAGPAPTGTTIIDLVYSVGLAVVVTVGAAVSPPSLRRWAAGLVTFSLCFAALDSGSFTPFAWALVAGVALAAAVAKNDATWGAAIGALVVSALWHIAPMGTTGVPSVLAVVAVGPLAFEALRRFRRLHPTLARFAFQLGLAALAWVAVAGTWTLLSSRPSIEEAGAAARNASELMAQGRLSEAIAEATVAARHASVPDYRLTQWYNRGLLAVPVLAQNLRAGTEMLGAGRSLLAVAEPVIGASVSIRHPDGRIDANGVSALAPSAVPLTSEAGVVAARAQSVDSVWLIGRFGAAVRAASDAGTLVQDRGEQLAQLFSAAPELLGADGPKRYLVLFMTPVEARELEGLVGNWALFIADDGLIRVERAGRIKDLNSRATRQGFADPDSYPKRYLSYRVEQFFQNVTASPDFPTVARGAGEIFPQMGGVTIDGVAAVDPFAIGALVGASGPISIPGFADPFDGDRVTQFLLFDQYQQLPDLEQREIVLDTLTRTAFSNLLESGVDRPDRLLEALDEPIRQRRLLFTTYDDATNEALDAVGLRGEFPRPRRDIDTISIRHDAAVARKIDGYIEREMSYSIESDPEKGESHITVVVKLTNSTPYGLLPYVAGTDADYTFPDESVLEPNDHLLRLSIYTTAELESVDVVNETPSPQGPDHYTEDEFGYHRHFLWAVARQGETITVTYELKSTYAPSRDDAIAVRVIPQPLVNDDVWTFTGTSTDTDATGRLGSTVIDAPARVLIRSPQ